MSIDGTSVDIADTAANDAEFGRPGSGRGEGRGAFPQVRLVGLAECGTHALVEVAMGPCRTAEQRLAPDVVGALRPGMLCLADRGFYSYSLWTTAHATGAELVWRTKSNHRLDVAEHLDDGSYLSRLYEIVNYKRRGHGTPVRVIEYSLQGPGQTGETRYRLLTTILDPAAAPAQEIAALYAQRWEFETTLAELKTHQRGPRLVLRSKQPDGVRQEIYGYLCVHYAIRWLMHTIATSADTDPDRLSFTRSLRVARRTTASHPGFSP